MFDKLKSIFIVDDGEGKKEKPVAKKSAPSPQAKSSNTKAPTPSSPATPSSGKVNKKFTDVLLRAMEANNLDGFDYLEFKQSLKSLEKMPMDEATRFKSAYAMAQTMGATPDHLIKTANHYVRVLLEEQSKFGQALANQRTKQIGDKENQIKQFENVIKEKTTRIEQMKAEIEKHTKDMKTLKGEISNAAVKVESTKNDFHASFNLIVGKIKKDIDSMKSFLK